MHHVLTRTADKPLFDLTMKAYGKPALTNPRGEGLNVTLR